MKTVNLKSDVNNQANLNILAKALYGDSAWVRQSWKPAKRGITYIYSVVASTGEGESLKAKKLGEKLRSCLEKVNNGVTYTYPSGMGVTRVVLAA